MTGRYIAGSSVVHAEPPSDPALMAAILEAGEPARTEAVRRLVVGTDGIVTLPAGTDLSAIVADGRDLIVPLPDGTRLVVVDGAVFIPELVIGTVEVPPATLVALLIGHEPQTAAGPPSSSGGNFAVPVGGLGDGYARGDLLPPTELAFGVPRVEELDVNIRVRNTDTDTTDLQPGVTIITPETPNGAVDAVASVNEAGLPARGAESPGSNAASSLETTTGTVQYTSGDAPAIVSVGGTAITGVGQAITTQYGVLTVTAVRDGAFDYSYTLSDNTLTDVRDVLNVVVTDRDGDTAPGTLTITIVDDVPTAIADVDRVSVPTGPIAATTVGVDFGDAAFWASVPAGSTQIALNGATLSSVNGALGFYRGASVFSPSDGRPGEAYTREIDAVNDQLEAVRVDFATAQSAVRLTLGQLYIESIISTTTDAEKVTLVIGLADGTSVTRTVAATETSQPGELVVALSAADFGGRLIQSVQLAPDPSGPVLPDTLSEAQRAQYANLAYSEFVLRGISYDVPAAAPSAPFADGNVFTGVGGTDANTTDGVTDVQGADGAVVTGVVAGTAASATGNLGTPIAGTYGSLTLSADGGYRYTPSGDNAELRSLVPGETRTDTFSYTITDGDGDTSTTTLVITLDGSDDPVAITGLNPAITGGDVLVDEANLANGTAPNATALTQTGDFTVTAPDGYGSVSIAGQVVLTGGTFTPATITTPLGNTLAVTGFDAATGVVSYQYTLNGPNGSGTEGATSDRVTESFAVVATDRDGSTSTGALVATILDDAPIVFADVDSVTVGSPGTTQTSTTVVDFTDTSLWSGVPSGSTTLSFDGVELSSINGALNYYRGASVLSPNDRQPGQAFTVEVDSYNDQPEGLRLSFAEAQSTVRVTLGQLYLEKLFVVQPDPEKVTVTVTLDDGTTATRTVVATALVQPGEASISLNSADFGGHLIESIVLAPDPSTPTLSPGQVIGAGQIRNATTPYSDFVLRGVEFETTTTTPPTRSVADGNVLTGIGGTDANATDGVADLLGADGGQVTAVGVRYNSATGVVGAPVQGTYGTLTMTANGDYTYVLNNDLPRVQGLAPGATLIDRFSYSVTDGDGDRATTTLVISIRQPAEGGARVASVEHADVVDTHGLSVAMVDRAAERASEAGATASLTTTLVAAAVVAVAAPVAAIEQHQDHAVVAAPAAAVATDAAVATHVAAVEPASAPTPVAALPVAESHAPVTEAAHQDIAAVGTGVAGIAPPAVEDHGHATAATPAVEAPPAPPAVAFIDTAAIPVVPAAAAPAATPTVAVTQANDAHVATVLADVLHGGAPASAPGLDQLLAALPVQPQGEAVHDAPPAFLVADAGADHLAAAWSAMAMAAQNAAMTSAGHDGVTAVAHAA